MPIDEPVKGVTVKARRFLKLEIKQTDRNGRFQMTKQFRNKATVIVKFKNSRITTRGIYLGLLLPWQYVFPIRQNLGSWSKDNINNITHTFIMDRDERSLSTRSWTGATTMNAYWDTDEFNRENGIITPPHLKVWLSNGGLSIDQWASAPMLNYVFSSADYGSRTFLAHSLATFSAVVDLLLLASAPYFAVHKRIIESNKPDITLRYSLFGNNKTWALTSENFYNTFMHEFSHASHYWGLVLQNGREGTDYYLSNIRYVLKNGGYGERDRDGAERTGIIEAWGFFAGDRAFERKYLQGTYASSPEARQLARRAIRRLDRHQFDLDDALFLEGRGRDDNFYRGWIPAGLLQDLNDDIELDNFHLNDNFSGYSINSIFKCLQFPNNTAGDFRLRLISKRPVNVQPLQIENLAREFGYGN
jgi:hypothetical protein